MVVKLDVGKGKPELFKQLSKELAEIVESDEPSTIEYEWFMADAAETCYIIECYPDTDALLSHLDSVSARL